MADSFELKYLNKLNTFLSTNVNVFIIHTVFNSIFHLFAYRPGAFCYDATNLHIRLQSVVGTVPYLNDTICLHWGFHIILQLQLQSECCSNPNASFYLSSFISFCIYFDTELYLSVRSAAVVLVAAGWWRLRSVYYGCMV